VSGAPDPATSPELAALLRSLGERFALESHPVRIPNVRDERSRIAPNDATRDVTLDILRPRDAESLISEADFARDERLPYWADVWPSARVLAARVLGEAGTGRSLLELGCGSGVVAAAAARAGFAVMATDYYDDALDVTRANVWRLAGVEPAVRHVDWRAFPDDLGWFDLVVASDVLYERPYARLVARAYARTLARGGLGLLADPGRIAAPDFVHEARALGLDVGEPEEHPIEDDGRQQTIRLYRLRRR
jgi:predicted nicotinamide N-methyase